MTFKQTENETVKNYFQPISFNLCLFALLLFLFVLKGMHFQENIRQYLTAGLLEWRFPRH